MAALDFRNLIINSILAALFLLGIFVMAISLPQSNEVSPLILNDPQTNDTLTNLSNQLVGIDNVATAQREGFESEIPQIGTDSFLFESVISSGKIFSSSMSGLGNVAVSYVTRGLGLNEGYGFAVTAVFITILVVLIILLAWKIYKTGF